MGVTTTILLTSVIFISSYLATFFIPDLDPSASASYLERVSHTSAADNGWWDYGYSSAVDAGKDFIGLAVHTLNDALFHQDDGGFSVNSMSYSDMWTRMTSTDSKSAKAQERAKLAEEYLKYEADRKASASNARHKSGSSRGGHPDKQQRMKDEVVRLSALKDGLEQLKEELEQEEQERLIKFASKRASWFYRTAQRFVVGLSFLGIVSFVNLLISLSFYAPAQIMRRGRGWFGGRRGGDRARGGIDVGTALVVLFVAIGVMRCVWLTRHPCAPSLRGSN